MKTWLKKSAAALLALMLLLTGCAAKEDAPAATQVPEVTKAPEVEATETPEATDASAAVQEESAHDGILSEFTSTDLDGNEVTPQSAFGGYDLVMINVWGTFCGPCISEMPDLGELSDELAEKNIRVVGLVTDAMGYDGAIDPGILEAAKEIVEKTGADYLHILPSEDLMGLIYQIQAVPTTFFVDEYGCQVGAAYAGARDKDAWRTIVEETLAQKK